MIYDKWRTQNNFGECNSKPSMTEPSRVYTVYDYLRDPSLALGSRKPVSEPSDPRDLEIDDSWSQEIPRDPDLYGAGDAAARPARRQASGAKDKSPQPEAAASFAAASAAGKQAAGAESANQAARDEEA